MTFCFMSTLCEDPNGRLVGKQPRTLGHCGAELHMSTGICEAPLKVKSMSGASNATNAVFQSSYGVSLHNSCATNITNPRASLSTLTSSEGSKAGFLNLLVDLEDGVGAT